MRTTQPSSGVGTTATTPILLSSTQVNLNEGTGAKQALYTCPASRKALITNIVMRHFSAEADVVALSFGWNAGASDVTTNFGLGNYAPDGSSAVNLNIADAPTALNFMRAGAQAVGSAGDILGLIVSTPEGSPLTAIVDVYGYLTDTNGVPIPNVGGGASSVTLNQVSDVTTTASELNALHGVKRYVALLSQSGENAPIAVELENSVGAIVWTRVDAGQYRATLNGAFLLPKTWYDIKAFVDDPSVGKYTIYREGDNSLMVVAVDGDDTLDHQPLIIEVYP